MSYRVNLTQSAVEQAQEIVQYISETLLVPDVAQAWMSRLKAEIGKLSFMPGRFPLTEEEPWRSKGIRRAVVENFLVYFWIDEPQNIVWVTAIVYGRRDRIAALMDMPLQ